MTRPVRAPAGAALLLALTLASPGCSAPAGLTVQGSVEDDLLVIAVPALATPVVDLDAGFPATASTGTSAAPVARPIAATTFALVARVDVQEGDTVSPGQSLVLLDDRLLAAQVRLAEAQAGATGSQLGVLDARIADTRDAERQLADKRAEVGDAIAELNGARDEVTDAIDGLTTTRTDLLSQQAKAKATRADLIEKRKQASAALAQLPPAGTPLPPGTPTRPELEAAIAGLTAGIAQLDTGLKKLADGLDQLDTGLDKARAGLKKIEDGLTKAHDGLRKLDDAKADLLSARAELTRLRRLAEVAAQTAAVPVDLARTQLAQAQVTSPVAGTVVKVAAAGDLLAAGASLVTIRRSAPSRLTTWLSPAQTARVCEGGAATVHGDWMADGETIPATLTRIAPGAEFPPTSQATDEVHLTRAFLVELSSTTTLPAGVPVTVSIQPCQPASPAPTR